MQTGLNALKRGAALFRARFYYEAFVACFLALIVLIGMADPFFVQGVRLIGFDLYQRLGPRIADPALPVRVVDIDDRSLAAIGQWPWPRNVMGQLRDKLAADGAAVVAFDVMFAEPDRTSLDQIAAHMPPATAAALAQAVGPLVSNDAIFAQSIAQAPTVLATTFTGEAAGVAPPAKAGFAIAGDDPRPFLNGYTGIVGNLPQFSGAAAGIGSINWIPDRDQIIRRVPLMFRLGDTIVPSLAAEALRVAQGASTYVLKSSNASGETAYGRQTGLNHIRIGAVEVPVDADGGIWVQFRRASPESYIPAWKVLQGKVAPGELAGQIVLVGTSAPGLIDLRATPLDASISGVEVHAQVIEQILSQKFLTRPDYAHALELFITVALGALLALLLQRMPALVAAPVGVAFILVILAMGWSAYEYMGLLFDALYPAFSLFLLIAGATAYLYRRTELQRSEVRRAFGQYVSPTVVHELIAHPEKLVLGGEERELTLMFCDVRNFTQISEGLSATELTRFINEFLTPLTDRVLASSGTIDKYMGDAIMAFWNAPLDDPDHVRHACETACAIYLEMAALNETWRKAAEDEGRPYTEVRIGIGLNTGLCCVGNLGSTQRFDYSAIGDGVNTTSRFEGLSKHYGLTSIVGEPTATRCPQLRFLEIDLVQVKGKSRPTRIYTLMDTLGCPPDKAEEIAACHAAFLARYRARDWSEASARLEKCRDQGVKSLETLYNLFESRIEAFRENPPPADWDGTFVAEEK
jgi:adenylate cyclase